MLFEANSHLEVGESIILFTAGLSFVAGFGRHRRRLSFRRGRSRGRSLHLQSFGGPDPGHFVLDFGVENGPLFPDVKESAYAVDHLFLHVDDGQVLDDFLHDGAKLFGVIGKLFL